VPRPDGPTVTGHGLSAIYTTDNVVFEAGKFQIKGVPAKTLTSSRSRPTPMPMGVRHLDMPLRVERVWRTLHQETKR
jgi:hypothetical protein